MFSLNGRRADYAANMANLTQAADMPKIFETTLCSLSANYTFLVPFSVKFEYFTVLQWVAHGQV